MNNLSNSNGVEVYEKKYRDALAKSVKGVTEVDTPVGRIDVLSQEEVIEVKRASDWKAAVGQAVIYSAYYPQHGKRIHLFGNVPPRDREIVEIACNRIGVRVTWAEPILISSPEKLPFPDLIEDVLPERVSKFVKIAECKILEDRIYYKKFQGSYEGMPFYKHLSRNFEEINLRGIDGLSKEMSLCCTLLIYLEETKCYYDGATPKIICRELDYSDINYCGHVLSKMARGGMLQVRKFFSEEGNKNFLYSLGYNSSILS